MLGTIIYLLLFGLLFGALGRLLVPGRDPMGLLGTMLLGIVGSLVGGFLGYVLFGADVSDGPFQASGLIGSLVGTVITLLVYRRMART